MSNRFVDRVNPAVSVVFPPGQGAAFYGSWGSTAESEGGVGPQSIPTAPDTIVAKLDKKLAASTGFLLTNVGGGNGIVVPVAGIYEVTYSVQLETVTGTQADIVLWLLKNGAAVPDTSSLVAMTGNNRYVFPYFSAFISLAPGDSVAIALTNTGGDTPKISPFDPTATYPGIPGAILSVKRIGDA